MADTKISGLAAGTTIVGTEAIPMVQGGATVKTTPTAITLSLSTATSTGLSTATSSIVSLSTAVAGKQATLVSATNIKTINSSSLLGAGDLVVSAAPGGSTTEIQFNDAGSLAGDAALTWDKTNNVLAIAQGTLTTSQPQTITATWNNGAVTFTGWKMNVTATASASASLLMDLQVGGSSMFSVRKDGQINFAGTTLNCTANQTYIANTDGNFLWLTGTTVYSFKNIVLQKSSAKISGDPNAAASGTAPLIVQGADCEQNQDGATGLTLKGGNAAANASTNIVGGHVQITGGDGAANSAGNAHGGNIILTVGTKYGTGHNGYVIISSIPTSSAGLPSGALWSNSGVLTIV